MRDNCLDPELSQKSDALPLRSYGVIRSSHLGDVKSAFAAHLPAHRMSLDDPRVPFGATLNAASLGAFRLCVSGINTPASVEATLDETVYLIHLPLIGEVAASVDGVHLEQQGRRGFIASPQSRLAIKMGQGAIGLQIQVSAPALHRHLKRLGLEMKGSVVGFDPSMPSDSTTVYGITSHVRYVMDVLESPLRHSSILQGELERTLLSLLLLTLPNAHSKFLLSASDGYPLHVTKAEQFLKKNLDRRVGVQELARISGVSERTLFNAYQVHLGLGPVKRGKLLRLQAAHEALQMGGADRTVTDIGLQFGFEQLGRFAAEYSEVYGMRPSDTLHRRPCSS